jgi:hypothetical protein
MLRAMSQEDVVVRVTQEPLRACARATKPA